MPPAPDQSPFYITTPIYYVNDRPHIGHAYTTIVADCVARFMRASGRDVFFLTGTDEHAEKVVTSAAQRGLTPIEWADVNAAEFQKAFTEQRLTHDDFIRTTQQRHTSKVQAYIQNMLDSGDVYLGEYEGWYDPSQEEYVTESEAKQHEYKSPVTGRDLEKRKEHNYFFRLSAYADRLAAHIAQHPEFVEPEARRNEVLGRLKTGLQDVPISRRVREGDEAWGVLMPGDDQHRVYVWIDALFNYLSAVDTDDRRKYWPAQTHVIAKDILWFHAVIWPCMLMALGKDLPGSVYTHAYWVREGRKMSKSLGNFLDGPTIRGYVEAFSLDAWRWYMLTRGPLGATDADFVHANFVEVYNADLANGIGNAASRVANMIRKYFDGACPENTPREGDREWSVIARAHVERASECMAKTDTAGALHAGLSLSNEVDAYVNETAPFKLAKDPANLPEVGGILYRCAEALRIAAILVSPALITKSSAMLRNFSQPLPDSAGRFLDDAGSVIPLHELCAWGRLEPGTPVVKGEALFPRADPKDDPPAPIEDEDAPQ
ncbi:MAG: methionine--tRNA ligase [Planctomycetota bacterium]